ncbi:MAG: YncE family protein [Acidobacteria bacterium]|nr:YncE family protein [Acidobacteriota bacterium]
MRTRIALSALLLGASLSLCAQAPALPHVLHETKLGGEGGWDYLICDSAARRIYISRGTHTMVVDADTGKVVGDIADTSGVHGIAVADDLGLGFTSNGRANSVTCFDLKTLKTLRVIQPTGEGPDAILYDPFSKRVFTFNGHGHSVTAINAATGAIEGTLPLAGKPEFAATDEAGRIFVNLEDKSQIAVFGAKDLKLQATWGLGEVEEPSGLAYDAADARLYSTGGNAKVAVVDAKTGKLLASIPSGEGTDAAGFDAGNGLAYASNGAGTLTVLKGLTALGNVPTARGARTLAVDTKTHHVFLVTAEFGPASAPSAEHPRPRPSMIPGSFKLIEVGN